MCGIGGILRVWPAGKLPPPPDQAIPEPWLDLIDEAIKHRGPDGKGRFRDRVIRSDGATLDVALVHRRMSIVDLAGGGQPMVSERGREGRDEGLVAVVFNGCIYNHRQLRQELQSAGHRFVTDHSDTEVLVHGWREWGPELFDRADGMLAAAIWDKRSARLLLARDRFGEKPLYILGAPHRGDLVAFSSCVPGLLRLQRATGISPDLQDRTRWVRPWVQFGWNQWMTDSIIHEWQPGILRGLSERGYAEPSHCFAYDCLNPTHEPLTLQAADAMIRTAVESRLEADVPVGCFLSGGLDSSLIAAHAARARPDIAAYTVRMPDPGFDESPAAAAVAAKLKIRHHILDCDARPAEDLVAAIGQLGLPFGDSSLLPSIWVSRAARQEVKVALAGDGGDEMFLGYNRHPAIQWLNAMAQLPDWSKRLAAHLAPSPAGMSSIRRYAGRLVAAATHDGYKDLVAIFPPPFDALLGLCKKGTFGWSAIPHFGMTTRGADDPQFAERTALRFDRMFYLPFDLLRKSDTASMSVALEVRSPFLESNLSRAAVNAPKDCLMPGNERKGLLRQVARKYLPIEVVDRPKQGFAIPIGDWFRTDYGGMRTMLLDHLNSADPWPNIGVDLNRRFVKQMLDQHMNMKRDHSQRLYMLLVLSIWAKAFLA